MAALRKLDVPLTMQPRNSAWCGAACAHMLTRYHGTRTSLRRLAQELRVGSSGILSPRLGTWFLEHGFDVTIIGYEDAFPNRFITLDADEARVEVLDWCARETKDLSWHRKSLRRVFPHFFEAGGKFLPRPVSRRDIRSALRRGLPPIIAIDVVTLYLTRERVDPHYVVVTGLSRDTIALNDPYPEYGGAVEYDLDRFLHACYRNSGEALFIKPR